MPKLCSEIEQTLKDNSIRYQRDFALNSVSSMKVGGKFYCVVIPSDEQQLKFIHDILSDSGISYMPIGEAKNILLSSSGYDGAAVKLGDGFSYFKINENEIDVGAALPMERLAREARLKMLSGLEFASSLPGSVGGCVVQNSRAFGCSIFDSCRKIRILTSDGNYEELDAPDYYKKKKEGKLNNHIVCSALFELESEPEHEIDRIIEKYRYIRGMIQPAGGRASGIIFDDNSNQNAHQMIERVGALSLDFNGTRWYSRFPNYITTKEGSSAEDVYMLISSTKKMVKQHFNVDLSVRLVMTGSFDTEGMNAGS